MKGPTVIRPSSPERREVNRRAVAEAIERGRRQHRAARRRAVLIAVLLFVAGFVLAVVWRLLAGR